MIRSVLDKSKWVKLSFIFVFLIPYACLSFDLDKDYENHKNTFNTFFKRESKNQKTKSIIENFNKEYIKSPTVSPIELNDISARSRILLLSSISQIIFNKYKQEEKSNFLGKKDSYFKEYKNLFSSKEEIVYSFKGNQFAVNYSPTTKQPGNLVIRNLSKCEEFYKAFGSEHNKNKSKDISEKFIKKFTGVDTTTANNTFFTPLTMFFDFEIARRLIKSDVENDYDDIPISSAIINFLNLSKVDNDYHISKLFNTPDTVWAYYSMGDGDEDGRWEYKEYNPFEGEPWMREAATKNILFETYKKSGKQLTPEEITKTYDVFFGGQDED